MKKTIAILGVDGTGKSTVIDKLSNKLYDRCFVQYMGYRSFENPKIEMIQKKTDRTRWDTLYRIWLIYLCYWKRYNNAVNSEKIVLFDRYVHEIYINAKGFYRLLYTFLYKYLYPKPKRIVYLYCSSEISFKRKSDILDPAAFKAMKKRFDDIFLNNKDCLCLNTEKQTADEIVEIILNSINHI
jgi:thymidylate kinase